MIALVHGFLGAPSMWSSVVGEKRALTLPGHCGRAPMEGASFEQVSDALAAECEGARVLVGYSMGARLVLSMLLRATVKVDHAVLIGVDVGCEGDAREERRRWERSMAARIREVGLDVFALEWEALPIFRSQQSLDAEAMRSQRAQRSAHEAEGVAWAMRSLGTASMPDYWPLLSSLRTNVTVVTGSLDGKFTEIAQRMQRENPRVRHRWVGAAGHNVELEAPGTVSKVLREERV